MSNISRHHHYLPQFYLGGFTEEGNQDGKLYVIDIEEGRDFKTSPRNVGAQRDFNRVDLPNLKPDALENSLSEFEGHVAEVLRWMEENRKLPDDEEDYGALMLFISILGARNPVIRNTFVGFQNEALQRLAELMVSSPEIWEKQLANMREEGIEIPEGVTYEYMKKFVEEQRYEIKYTHGYHASLEFQGVDAILPYMWERGWTLCVPYENEGHFICSDRPVAIRPTKPGVRYLGFGMKYTDVTVPLSKNMALTGRFEQEGNTILKSSEPLINAFNGHTCEMADKQIYASSEEFYFLTLEGGKKHSSDLLK